LEVNALWKFNSLCIHHKQKQTWPDLLDLKAIVTLLKADLLTELSIAILGFGSWVFSKFRTEAKSD
jgi:hypothetical protein